MDVYRISVGVPRTTRSDVEVFNLVAKDLWEGISGLFRLPRVMQLVAAQLEPSGESLLSEVGSTRGGILAQGICTRRDANDVARTEGAIFYKEADILVEARWESCHGDVDVTSLSIDFGRHPDREVAVTLLQHVDSNFLDQLQVVVSPYEDDEVLDGLVFHCKIDYGCWTEV